MGLGWWSQSGFPEERERDLLPLLVQTVAPVGELVGPELTRQTAEGALNPDGPLLFLIPDDREVLGSIGRQRPWEHSRMRIAS